MLKMGFTLILTGLLVLILSTASFASIQLNPVEPGDIELIAPKIGSERQVFVKDSMAISIRSVEVDVSLFKVMPSSHNAYLDEVCESEMVLLAEDVPFKVISGSSIVAKDLATENDLEKTAPMSETAPKMVIEITDTLDSDEIIDGSQALLQKERLSSKDRQEIIQTYIDARSAFESRIKPLEKAYDAYIEMFPEGHEDGYEYSNEELEAVKDYLLSSLKVHELCVTYQEAKNDYETIFEIPLFGPEDVSDTGILPYYQKTVEKITPGLYKFVFSDQDNNEIIEVMEFEVVKKEELTEEVIKEAMPSNVGNLILPSVDLTDLEESEENPSQDTNTETKTTDKEGLENQLKNKDE